MIFLYGPGGTWEWLFISLLRWFPIDYFIKSQKSSLGDYLALFRNPWNKFLWGKAQFLNCESWPHMGFYNSVGGHKKKKKMATGFWIYNHQKSIQTRLVSRWKSSGSPLLCFVAWYHCSLGFEHTQLRCTLYCAWCQSIQPQQMPLEASCLGFETHCVL